MNKKKIISFVILFVGIVCLGTGICLNLFFTTTKKGMFTNALTQSIENIVPGVQEFASSLAPTKSFSHDGVTPLTVDTNTLITSVEEKMSLNGKVIVDVSGKKGYGNFTLGMNDAKAMFEMYLQDTRLYIKVQNAFKKFYYTDMQEENLESSLDTEELEKMLNEVFTEEEINKILGYLKESIIDNITEEDFKEEEVELKLGDSTFKTTKLTLDITDKLVANVMADFFTKIKNDTKLINGINKLGKALNDYSSDMTGEVSEEFDAAKALDEAIKELEQETSVEILCSYSMYVEGKDNVLRHELVLPPEDDTTLDRKIVLNMYENKDKFNNYEFILLNGDNEGVAVRLIGTGKNTKSIKVSYAGESVLTGTYEKNDNKCNIVLNLNYMGYEASFTYLYEIVEVNKKIKFDLTFSLGLEGTTAIDVVSSNTLSVGGEIPEFDPSQADSIENITQEELDAANNLLSSLQM